MEQDDAPVRSGTPIVVNIPYGEIDGLQKEIVGRQEGEENGVGGGGEISNNATIQCPLEKTLTNPVILLSIFSHLEFQVLLDLRLVCKVWDEVVRISPEFRKMFWISVPRLFSCCTIAPVPVINPKLTKKIYITSDPLSWCTNRDVGRRHTAKNGKEAAAFNLTSFLYEYHHYVENIKFNVKEGNSLHTYLVNALNALDFPELQTIAVQDDFDTDGRHWPWDDYEDDFISTFATFSTRPNLTSLQLDNTIAGSPFHGIFQKLINCAPTLEKITIHGNFYPDLSTCKNLKTLDYTGIPYCYDQWGDLTEEPSFNLESLSTMLGPAKHSLIELTLEDSYFDCPPSVMDGHLQLQEFKFPDVAEKLKILRIQENAKPFFQPELKKLNPMQFPILKHLTIVVKSLDNVLEGISHSFGTISYLRLSGIISPNIMHRIPIVFPNLTSLTIPWSVGRENENPNFDEVIDFCSEWKLRKLDIGITLQSDWCAFTSGLGRLKQTQKDMKLLKLPSQDNTSSGNESKPVFDLWYDTKKQQQHGGTVNMDHILQNFTFGPPSMKKGMEGAALKFIFDHPLAVHFI